MSTVLSTCLCREIDLFFGFSPINPFLEFQMLGEIVQHTSFLKINIFLIGRFTILCWFLLYNNVNQSWLYIYIPSHLSLPPNSLSHPSRSSQITRLGFLCYIASSHCLSILRIIVNICQCYFLNLSHPHLVLLCPQVHSILGSSVPVFQISYICVSFSLSDLFLSMQETLGSSTSLQLTQIHPFYG